ncbi:hypothetical protein [Parvularcula maris]|uniref:Uncharacterized protein n=1 Tax=Parvularcula maris TaxID=2965077 RepID=A0A9X2LBR9_9PROT|nr:hypothetical protein [Parvularcula maris]MCQ8185647.1 hypothetical protein [Parvularcula maris]
MRFLRAAVRLRQWRRREKIARILARGRKGTPFLASLAFNLALIVILAAGYTSFVAKGVVGAGLGERVITVRFFEQQNRPEQATPEALPEEELPEPEEAEIGAETLPEGIAITEGEEVGEDQGDEAPQAEEGADVTSSQLGVAVPSIALPDVDAGEGRPDGIVGVDCYRIFRGDREKALECAGREILSGWRAEIANLGEDWDRFGEELGTGRRAIRYGPLRGTLNPADYGLPTGMEVSPTMQRRYEQALAAQKARSLEALTEQSKGTEKAIEEERRRDQDAATYSPVSPSGDG